MIRGTFSRILHEADPYLFRAHTASFWMVRFLKDIDFFVLPEKDQAVKPAHLVIFRPEYIFNFRTVSPESFILWLQISLKENHSPFTVASEAFCVFPADYLEKNNLDSTAKISAALSESSGFLKIECPFDADILPVKAALFEIESSVKALQIRYYHSKGVVFDDFSYFYIEGLPEIGSGTRISSGVVIKGDSEIGKNAALYPNCFVENSRIGCGCQVLPGCVIRDSVVEKNSQIGPFSHLRNNARVQSNTRVGNYVEIKKSVLGENSKASHLTYLGDAEIGKNVNVGAGTITCNYDGVNKNRTVIEDNVFIGSGTELVAPVKIMKNSYVGAGSTITRDVPEDSLAIARERQRNIPDWVKKQKKPDRESS